MKERDEGIALHELPAVARKGADVGQKLLFVRCDAGGMEAVHRRPIIKKPHHPGKPLAKPLKGQERIEGKLQKRHLVILVGEGEKAFRLPLPRARQPPQNGHPHADDLDVLVLQELFIKFPVPLVALRKEAGEHFLVRHTFSSAPERASSPPAPENPSESASNHGSTQKRGLAGDVEGSFLAMGTSSGKCL